MSLIQKVILITIFKEVSLTQHHIALTTEMRENNLLTPLPNVFHFTTLPGILFSLMSF